MGIPLTDEQLKAADVGGPERSSTWDRGHCTDILSSYIQLLSIVTTWLLHHISFHIHFSMVPEAQNFFALKENSPEAPCPGLVKQLACTQLNLGHAILHCTP